MNNMVASFVGGFIATVVLTVIMLVQYSLGLATEADYIGMVTQFANENMQLPPFITAGWVINYFVGIVVYGLFLALFNDLVPEYPILPKAIILAVVLWFVMMLIIMPVLGHGLFGLRVGAVVPFVTLIYHLIFGVVLGLSYRKLHNPEADKLD